MSIDAGCSFWKSEYKALQGNWAMIASLCPAQAGQPTNNME